MDQLFKKALCFTDMHVGLKQNSKTHNEDCFNFASWACEKGRSLDCDTLIFLGDFSHHRNSVNITTLNYSVNIIEMLSKSFKQVIWIIGNHDLFFREKRDYHSIPYGRLFPNVKIINDITLIGQVALLPFLVGDEWKQIPGCKYIFGHLELPHFILSGKIKMPDHGGLNATYLKSPDYVFSGHFHKVFLLAMYT